MKKFALIIITTLLTFNSASAQVGKYGTDSATCVMNISLFNEYYKQKNYDDAIGPWRWVFNNCPAGTKRTYLYGETMFEELISKTTDEKIKSAYTDTLMMIFDQRIENFGEEGYVLGKKGLSMYEYTPEKKEEVAAILEKSLKLQGTETGPLVIYRYFQVNTELYKEGKRSKEQILDVYDQCSEIVDINMEGKDSANYAKSQQNLETFFGPFATCEDLEEIYKPRVKAAPDDVSLLKKVVNLLGKKGCNSSQLYLQSAEKLYKLQPSSRSAVSLARMYAGQGVGAKVTRYYTEAVELESDPYSKARYLIELSDYSYRTQKNYSQAKTYAKRAVSTFPSWGRPYMQLGDIYVAGSGTCGDDFEKNTAFWAATDQYQKAKSVDPAFSTEASNKIQTYSKYFPKQEDVFFRNLKPGDKYNVGCWINETTTVKVK